MDKNDKMSPEDFLIWEWLVRGLKGEKVLVKVRRKPDERVPVFPGRNRPPSQGKFAQQRSDSTKRKAVVALEKEEKEGELTVSQRCKTSKTQLDSTKRKAVVALEKEEEEGEVTVSQRGKTRKTIKVFYSNVRSLQCKINELSCIVCELKPDIVILTETWCNESISSAILQISGFNIDDSVCIDRTVTVNGIGGGIIVYVRNGLTVLSNDKSIVVLIY